MKIDWIVSDNQRDQLAPLVERALSVAPDWLREVTIRYDPSFDDGVLNVTVQEQYRIAAVRVADAWFAEQEDVKASTWVHEVMHMYLRRYTAACEALLRACTEEDSPLRKWGESELERAEEACVCDLAAMVYKLLPEVD